MLLLSDIKDWIKTLGIGENFYTGKLDNKKEKSIGIYQRPSYGKAEIAIGGLKNTKTRSKQISILIHWSKYSGETERAAQRLYDAIAATENLEIAGKHVDIIKLDMPEPADVGTDDAGVYERVIWLTFYYQERKDT